MMEEKSEKRIYRLSYFSVMFLMIASSFLGLTSFMMFQLTKQNSFIAAIIGAIIGSIIIISFRKIKKMALDKDIIEYNVEVFGKFFGNIINIILNISIFVIANVLFENIIMFISTNYLMETSLIYIKILFLCAIAYAASKKISTIMKAGNIIALIEIGLVVLSVIGVFPRFKVDRIFPILECDIQTLLRSSIIYTVCGLFSIFLLTIIPMTKIHFEEKGIYKTYIFSNIFIIFIIFVTTITLGGEVIDIFKYPEYLSLQEFSLFSIIERVENTLSLQFLFNTFITLTIMIYFMSTSIKKFIKKSISNYNKIVTIITYTICVLILIFSKYVFPSSVIFTELIQKYYFYIILIGIIFPMFITLFGGMIKEKLKIM